jgi:hypothetical protein
MGRDIILKILLGQLRTLLAAVAGYLVAAGWLETEYADEFVAIGLFALASLGSVVNKTTEMK